MGFQLHETMYGKNFFEHQLPALIRAINRLADVDEKRQAAEPAAVMKSNTVYVCYEENSHELAIKTVQLMNYMLLPLLMRFTGGWINSKRMQSRISIPY